MWLKRFSLSGTSSHLHLFTIFTVTVQNKPRPQRPSAGGNDEVQWHFCDYICMPGWQKAEHLPPLVPVHEEVKKQRSFSSSINQSIMRYSKTKTPKTASTHLGSFPVEYPPPPPSAHGRHHVWVVRVPKGRVYGGGCGEHVSGVAERRQVAHGHVSGQGGRAEGGGLIV